MPTEFLSSSEDLNPPPPGVQHCVSHGSRTRVGGVREEEFLLCMSHVIVNEVTTEGEERAGLWAPRLSVQDRHQKTGVSAGNHTAWSTFVRKR